jgi:hypothetical protein
MPSQDGGEVGALSSLSSPCSGVTGPGSETALFLAGASHPGAPAFEAAVAEFSAAPLSEGGEEGSGGAAQAAGFRVHSDEGKDSSALTRALVQQNAVLLKVHRSLHQLAHNLEVSSQVVKSH